MSDIKLYHGAATVTIKPGVVKGFQDLLRQEGLDESFAQVLKDSGSKLRVNADGMVTSSLGNPVDLDISAGVTTAKPHSAAGGLKADAAAINAAKQFLVAHNLHERSALAAQIVNCPPGAHTCDLD